MRGPPARLRALTAEEASAVEVLVRSRTAPARRVERARIIRRAGRGETPPAIAAALGLDAETVRRRIRRFNAEGLAALDDHHRSGRPATYKEARRVPRTEGRAARTVEGRADRAAVPAAPARGGPSPRATHPDRVGVRRGAGRDEPGRR